MVRTFVYALRVNRAQAATLESWLGVCCDLYNAALQERREAWRITGKNVALNAQYRELTRLRASDPEYASVPALALGRSAVEAGQPAVEAEARTLAHST